MNMEIKRSLLRQFECRMENNFQTQSILEESLLRTKSRYKVGTVSVAGWQLLTDQGESTVFVLVANFYSLTTKNISAGSLPLGDWLGHYKAFTEVGILPTWESGCLLVMIGKFWQGYKRTQSASEPLFWACFCGHGAKSLTFCLRQGSTETASEIRMILIKNLMSGSIPASDWRR